MHEEEASVPITPDPREQREKRVIRPPKRLTYDGLGESSEEVILTSQRTLDTPNYRFGGGRPPLTPWHI